MQPVDTVEDRWFFEIQGTDYVLAVEKHVEDGELMSPERFSVFIVNRNDPDFGVEEKDIYPMPQYMQDTLLVLKDGFKLIQDVEGGEEE